MNQPPLENPLVSEQPINQQQAWMAEWSLLHQQYQTFENYALLIKLVAITAVAVGFIMGYISWGIPGVVLICWLTEAVWKTYQGRTEADLLSLETQIRRLDGTHSNDVTDESIEQQAPMQLYTRWNEGRASVMGLIGEYVSAGKQPTVAITYILLVALILLAKAVR